MSTEMTAVPNAAAAGTITIGGDLTVNRLGFGAMRVTGRGIWGEPRDLDEARAVLRRAVEGGVTFIDTADSYGPHVSEQLIGEALYPYPENLVIATKGGLERPGPDVWTNNGRPEHLREACEGSLQRLRLEQIPLYQWHRPDPGVPLEDSVGALADLQREGKIRHIGVSNVTIEQLERISAIAPVVSVQNRYNAGFRAGESMLDYCAAHGIVFIPWAPMMDIDRTPAVAEIAERRAATTHQIMLAYLLAKSPALLPIPGTGSVAHVEENLGAAGITLSPEEMDALSAAA
jgi:aryl-alcohol dehydrogenase-like predicted oxidoreductase